MPAQVVCARCRCTKPGLVTLTHPARGIIFEGCSDCLVLELDVLSTLRAPQCSACGSIKSRVTFSNGSSRVDCQIHVQGRGLLEQAFNVLGRVETEEAKLLRGSIGDVLGVASAKGQP